MSYHGSEIGRAIGKALAAAHAAGSLGGGRRGGGIRKGPKRCYYCGSEEHLVKDCPRKGKHPLRTEAERVAQEVQQEASPPREAPPAPVERLALPSPPPPVRPSPFPAATQSPVQETIDVRVGIILPPHGPQFAPPPAPEPRTGRPPARLGRTVEWSELFNRYYYVHFLDGSVEWYEEQR